MNILDDLLNYLDGDVPVRSVLVGAHWTVYYSAQENALTIEGVAVLEGTPLIDNKPYVPDFDLRTDVRAGWYETRSEK
jgi:tRNA (Thr-GGU) A37 N-methylase